MTNTTDLCDAPYCAIPHETFVTFIDDGWCFKTHNPEPREHSQGHEALMIHHGPKSVTVSTEFGEHRSTVQIPTATFDRLVDQIRNGGEATR